MDYWLKHELLKSWHYEESADGRTYPVYVFHTPPMALELSINYNKIKQDRKFLFNFIEVGIGLEEIK